MLSKLFETSMTRFIIAISAGLSLYLLLLCVLTDTVIWSRAVEAIGFILIAGTFIGIIAPIIVNWISKGK